MNAQAPLRAMASISVLALACAPSTAARQMSYPPVYRLLAHMTEAGSSASGTFTATLAVRGGRGTLRWKLTFAALTGTAASAKVWTRRSGTTAAAAVRLCPPPACHSGVQGTYTGAIGTGSAFLTGLLHQRGFVIVRITSPAGELRGRVMVAVPAGS
jgi:hypothetical protein